MPDALRRKLEAGEMTWESQVCVQGTEDWLPAHVYGEVFDGRGRDQQPRADRQYRPLIVQGGTAKKAGAELWQATWFSFLVGVTGTAWAVFGGPGFGLVLSAACGLACLVCGILLMSKGETGKGIAGILFALLTVPVVVWIRL